MSSEDPALDMAYEVVMDFLMDGRKYFRGDSEIASRIVRALAQEGLLVQAHVWPDDEELGDEDALDDGPIAVFAVMQCSTCGTVKTIYRDGAVTYRYSEAHIRESLHNDDYKTCRATDHTWEHVPHRP